MSKKGIFAVMQQRYKQTRLQGKRDSLELPVSYEEWLLYEKEVRGHSEKRKSLSYRGLTLKVVT